ncbi:MAG: aminotransferase class V-fold PLP-dependent enzyme [Myxococcota bacterium]
MFGHTTRDGFALDPDLLYLNHGTVGVPPKRVLALQQRIRDQIEGNPSHALLRLMTEIGVGPDDGTPHLRVAAGRVAQAFGAEPRDVVFVDNTTTGINAVLRSFRFGRDEGIAVTSLGYGAINHAAAYVARERGVPLHTIDLPFRVDGPQALIDAFAAGLAPGTRVAVIDHICSDSGAVWPIEALVDVCHANGTLALVDGAHAPGCIPLDIPATGADWYVANLHKWAWSPRSSGILWARRELQDGLHPVVISWGLDQGFTAEFDYVGTRDPSAHLAAPEGLAMLEELGLDRVLAYNHALACEGVGIVADLVGGSPVQPDPMVSSMGSVTLPERFGTTHPEMRALRRHLMDAHRIEVGAACREGRISVRVAAQIYNEASDYARLGTVLRDLP